jgi:hypothetical protein
MPQTQNTFITLQKHMTVVVDRIATQNLILAKTNPMVLQNQTKNNWLNKPRPINKANEIKQLR